MHLRRSRFSFTPHLLPIPRGILSTVYLRRNTAVAQTNASLLRSFTQDSPMVRVRTSSLPQIQDVVRTNFCDIGFEVAPNGRDGVIVSCLDNLLKGAAGQAVQNLNVMCGWKEEEGLL